MLSNLKSENVVKLCRGRIEFGVPLPQGQLGGVMRSDYRRRCVMRIIIILIIVAVVATPLY